MYRAGFALAALMMATPTLAKTTAAWNTVKGVEVTDRGDIVEYRVSTSDAPVFRAFAKKSPATVVLDVVGAACDEQKLQGQGLVAAANLKNDSARGAPVARLEVKMAKAARYDVSARQDSVTLTVFKDPKREGAGVPRLAQAGGEFSEGEGAGGFGAAMTYIGFTNTLQSSKVFARMNSNAKFELKREGPNIMVLEITGASIPLLNNKNHLDTTYFDSPVRMITPTEVDGSPPRIRIIIEMKEDVPFSKNREGNDIVVTFQK
jgi:hypothetical protein